MEFTTRITEQDYLAAYCLKTKSTFSTIIFNSLYSLAALGGTAIIGTFIRTVLHLQDLSAAQNFTAVLDNIFPFECFAILCALFYKVYIPFDLRKKYRKTVSNRDVIVQKLSKEGISEITSAGSSVSYPWSVCEHWRESKGVFVLILQSGVYFTFPKAGLNAAQQDELRGILATALPKK